ncbi:MAG: glycosyltransferase family 4 protein [Kiritimatiellae bacterium]|nr:glycosyltransferase family 4 protein [Kiritimatiellia bacterium]
MKVAFLMQDTGWVYGAERATLDLAGGLSARPGIDVHVVLIREERLGLSRSRYREALEERGIPFSDVPARAAFSRALVSGIRRRLDELGADVLHAVGYKADVHGGLAAGWGLTLPTVSTVHGWLFRPDFKERFYGWLDVRALRRMGRVVVLSRYYRDLLSARGVSSNRLALIPSGLDAARLPPRADAEEPRGRDRVFTIGMLGRLSSEKNHFMLLRAMRRVLDQGHAVRCVMAGDGPEGMRVEREIGRLGLGDAVRMAGYVDHKDFFRQTDVLVICSHIENLPYSVLEAMAWCRPVIATGVGGLPDLVRDGENGFLVAADDDASLGDRIGSLAAEPARAARMGGAGRRMLEAEFTLAKTVDRHVELYGSLAEETI